jgi:predicted SnoaL-like aldol condensation-catalyzing enzyme
MEDNDIRARKQAAVQFLQLVIAGKIDEAYQKYVDMQGKHHNPSFPAGFPVLRKAMIENHVQYPNKHFTVKKVLGDGDLVAIHSHIVLQPGETGMVAVHLFRFDGDRIVEMWDCSQAVPADSPNKDGYFNKHDEANSFPIRFHTCGTYIRNYPGSAHLLLFRFLA